MDQPVIRYEHWEKGSGVFDFPWPACQRYLHQHLTEAPHDTSAQDLLNALEQQTQAEHLVTLVARQPGAASFMAAALLDEHIGQVYCRMCQRTLMACETIRETWERGRGAPLTGGGGRRFSCQRNHVLLNVTDWRA